MKNKTYATTKAKASKAAAGKIKTRSPNPIDVHVGSRIRLQRLLLGMTQQEFAAALGLTFQQVQKYERGLNRIAASRLYYMSQILGVDLVFFFQDMDEKASASSPQDPEGLRDVAPPEYKVDPMQKRETLELVRNYYRIKDPESRQLMFDLCEKLSRELVGRKPLSETRGS